MNIAVTLTLTHIYTLTWQCSHTAAVCNLKNPLWLCPVCGRPYTHAHTLTLTHSDSHLASRTKTQWKQAGQQWAGSMETSIDFYRHFSWLRKVSFEVLFNFSCFFSSFSCLSLCHILFVKLMPWRSFQYLPRSREKAHVYRKKGKLLCLCEIAIVSAQMHVIVLFLLCYFPATYCFLILYPLAQELGCISTCCSVVMSCVCLWVCVCVKKHASQGLCYHIRSIIHQLIAVDKAASDTAGFNHREKLPREISADKM